MRKSKLIVLLSFCVLVVLGGCSQSASINTETEERAFPVQIEQVTSGVLEDSKVMFGEIIPSADVSVAPKIAARIVSIHVKKGDQVQAGQTLAVLDQTDYQNNVRQSEVALVSAKANLENAKSNHEHNITQAEQNVENAKLSLENTKISYQNTVNSYNDAKANFERMKALYEASAISKREVEQAEMSLSQASSGLQQSGVSLKQAEAAIVNAEKALAQAKRTESIKVTEASVQQSQLSLDLAKEQLSNTLVKAPVSGEITTINLDIGEMASQQGALFQIIQIKPMLVKAKLTEESLKNFRVGDTVSISVAAVSEQAEGVVRFISSIPEPQTKAYVMEIEFTPSSAHSKPGMIAEIATGQDPLAEKVILVPISSLLTENQTYYVYIMEDNRAMKREVTLGQENIDKVEIVSGIQEGDQIIVKGHLTIDEGALVQVTGGQ